ncbi:hypothetical protein Trydic_g11759 [Trypoxylus dichotomus]
MDIGRRYAERRDLIIILTKKVGHLAKKTKRILSKLSLAQMVNRWFVIGKMHATLAHRKKAYKCLVYVIKGLKLAILGRPGIVNLGITKLGHSVLTTNAINITSVVNIERDFPLLFQEIGEFKEEIKINVKKEVKPVALTSPRIVPIPLLPKLQNELNRLQKINIIESMWWIIIHHVRMPRSFSNTEGRDFFKQNYNFKHVTSSAYFPQSNGAVEAAVEIAKLLLKKNDGIYLALMSYRATPLECGFSPSELLMSGKIKTLLPILPSKLEEVMVTKDAFLKKEEQRKDKQAILDIKQKIYGKIVKQCEEPRSYMVQTQNGIYRRKNEFQSTPHPEVNTHCNVDPSISKPSIYESTTNKLDICEHSSSKPNICKPTTGKCNMSKDKSESVGKQGTESRESKPKRVIKKPKWMGDYVQ